MPTGLPPLTPASYPLPGTAAVPIIPELIATSKPTDTTALKWIYVLRLLRLARVFRLLKASGFAVDSSACIPPGSMQSGRQPGDSRRDSPWLTPQVRLPSPPRLQVWGGPVFINSLWRGLQRYLSTAVLFILNLVLALTVLINLASRAAILVTTLVACIRHPCCTCRELQALRTPLIPPALPRPDPAQMGCVWWFVAELEGLENSWVAATGKPGGLAC